MQVSHVELRLKTKIRPYNNPKLNHKTDPYASVIQKIRYVIQFAHDNLFKVSIPYKTNSK